MKKSFTFMSMALVSMGASAQSAWTVNTTDKSYSFPIEEVTSITFTNDEPWKPDTVRITKNADLSLFQKQLNWTKEAIEKGYSAYPSKVIDVDFAPGQFTNFAPMPFSTDELKTLVDEYNKKNNTQLKSVAAAALSDRGFIDYCQNKLGRDSIKALFIKAATKNLVQTNKIGSYCSLGGWGGSVTVGFDHPLMNFEGADFRGYGNAFAGSSEPGVYYVAQKDADGKPGKWYMIKHAMYDYARHDYEVTYYRPEAERAAGKQIEYTNLVQYEYNHGKMCFFSKQMQKYLTKQDIQNPEMVRVVDGKTQIYDKSYDVEGWYDVISILDKGSYAYYVYNGLTPRTVDYKELNDGENHKSEDGKQYVESNGEWHEVKAVTDWYYNVRYDVNDKVDADTLKKTITLDGYTYQLKAVTYNTTKTTMDMATYDSLVKDNIYTSKENKYQVVATKDAELGAFSHYIAWKDNKGHTGWLPKNSFHGQSYYPLYAGDSLTIKGEYLPVATLDTSDKGTYYVNDPKYWGFPVVGNKTQGAYGFCDEYPNTDDLACIDIDWAVDENGEYVHLDHIDFVKCQTATHIIAGWLGENSTEFCGVEDLHIKLQMVNVDTSIKPDTTKVKYNYDQFIQ